MYSDMIENAAAVLSVKNGWSHDQAAEYIEDLVFNTNEDIPGLLKSIQNGHFEFHPPVRLRRRKKKGTRRDLWKSPYRIQMSKITGLSKQELDEIMDIRSDYFCRRHTQEERMEAFRKTALFDRLMYSEHIRNYCRINEFGIFDTGNKDHYYGIITKQHRTEKGWKRRIIRELSSENIHALKIH